MIKTLIALFISLLILTQPLAAATYYVGPKGSLDLDNDTTGTGSGTIGDPWSVGQAMATTYQPDDIIIFAAGTYYGGARDQGGSNTGYYNPVSSGTSSDHPITFRVATGATVNLHGTPSDTHTYFFGSGYQDYIVYDGFTFITSGGDAFNGIIIAGTSDNYSAGCVVRNCTFSGSTTTSSSTDNQSAIAWTYTDDLLIEDCTIYNFNGPSHNTSGTKSYHTNNTIIQNCEIYNCTAGLYPKSGSNGLIIRYNYVHDCGEGILLLTDDLGHINGSIYHNIIADCSVYNLKMWADGDYADYDIDNWSIYNNTFYNASAPLYGVVGFLDSLTSRSTSYIYRDNVIESLPGTSDSRNGLRWVNVTCEAGGFDYNAYGANPDVTQTSTHYTTLSTIQNATMAGLTSGNHNQHSIVGAVGFIAATGDRDTIAEFEITSGDANNGGSDGNDMGADISLVGPDGSESESPSTPSIRNGGFRSGGIR